MDLREYESAKFDLAQALRVIAVRLPKERDDLKARPPSSPVWPMPAVKTCGSSSKIGSPAMRYPKRPMRQIKFSSQCAL